MLILDTHIVNHKSALVALQAIYGINANTALKICAQTGINPKVKLQNLSTYMLDKLSKNCRMFIHPQKKRHAANNIKALIQIKHYRGVRQMFKLPVRGQRTKTNASTARAINKPIN